MGSFSDDEGECRFFDAPDSISQVSDSGSNCTQIAESGSGIDDGVSYDEWIKTPRSVVERRRQFRCWMGLSLDGMSGEDPVNRCGSSSLSTGEIERIMECSGAVLRTSIYKDKFSCSQSSMPGVCGEALDSSRSGNVDSGIGCNVHVQAENGQQSNNGAVKLERLLVSCEPKNPPCVSPVIGELGRGEVDKNGDTPKKLNGVKSRLLSRIRSFTCIANAEGRCLDSKDNSSNPSPRSRVQRVKVHHCKKRLKELSALFMGQDIQAHEGSILTMKFSFDGQYLASAGEDKIVQVWQEPRMANGLMKPVASLLLVLNFCMYAVVLGIAGWAMNFAIDHGFLIGPGMDLPAHFSPIYFPIGNAATGFFVVFALIAGVVGVASVLSGLNHIRKWNIDSLPAAASAAVIAWSLTLLAMGFAWKEIELNYRNAKLRTMEAFLIILSFTQLVYIAAIHGASSRT